jgi:phage tail tape-measure protein
MADEQDPEKIGGLAGLAAGTLTGAQLGTVAIPVPVLGTFAGALLGGVLGSRIGRQVTRPMLDALGLFKASTPGNSAPGSSSFSTELEELGRLRAKGVLTDEEYRNAVARLVS